MAHPKILAFVLAGGRGERLAPLTDMRTKPSVPFGGRFRIVDFVLSNLLNSHIYSIYLLVQYKSQSLIEHVRQNWVLSPLIRDHFVAVVPPQMKMGPEWFQGTADAVYQNINLIHDHAPEVVVVFGADHIYRMDIRQMIDFHIEKGADVTVAARPVPLEEASAFGVIAVDKNGRITGFQEKPKDPQPMPGASDRALVSMGNYLFSTNVLVDSLMCGADNQHDFGKHILPSLIGSGKVFAYDFAQNVVPGTKPFEEQGYWRDVGTIPAYFQAHMDMLGEAPVFDLHNKQWPIHPGRYQGPAAKILKAEIENSLISEGAIIANAKVSNSVIRRDVVIEDGTSIDECIIMESAVIRKGCRLRRVIIDKFNVLPEGTEIGFDRDRDRRAGVYHLDGENIVVLSKATRNYKGICER
ncbi:MAG: glucose-1-phosphate adenylyltransferase [Nitrospirota bacterium]|nr:glucose-1-phosphate adenylyltransferase [Nitrospirota bacterium]